MTNEEAIKEIQRWLDGCPFADTKEAFTMAIQALKIREQQELLTQLPNGIVYAPKLYQGCSSCDAHNRCPDAFCSNAVNCNAYGGETKNEK